MRPPRSAVAICLAAVAGAAGCSSPGPAAAPTPAPGPATVAAPVERTSDRGERTLPVAPIGRIAPEVPPEISPDGR